MSEAITPKEVKESVMKDSKDYKINSEKDLFEVKIGKNESNNKIIFRALKLNELIENFYEQGFSFDELVKLDRTFRAYDELEEIFQIILKFFEEKKVLIKEAKVDSIILGLKLTSIIGKEKIVDIKLFKKEMEQDSLIKELCKKINQLEQENKIFRSELDELKKWKKEKENEFQKLLQEKKNKAALENIDSKILTKAEELKFIEDAYKNNDKLLEDKIFKPKLLYRATKDGDSSAVFHSKCDNVKYTLTLVKTNNGLIFGGYTTQTWDGNGYKKDDKAFCFSIDLHKIYRNRKNNNAINANSGQSATFGDYFFCVYDKCLSKGGMMNDGLNNNYDNQQKENEINNGEKYFGISEVEVFKVILE